MAPAWPTARRAPVERCGRSSVCFHLLGVIEDMALRYNESEIDRKWVNRMLANSLSGLLDDWWRVVWFLRTYRMPLR
jgi:hypothetical protein